jgi:very-short-patch-repair endonuclease
MGQAKPQWSEVWALAERQHGVVARRQLAELGANADWIQHRIERRRLHPVLRGVYAIGRPALTQRGRWVAAVLACGPGAALSHRAAGALYAICPIANGPIDVSVPGRCVARHGSKAQRRSWLTADRVSERGGIAVTTAVDTIIDLGTVLSPSDLQGAINEADKRNLIDPETLRAVLDDESLRGRPGVAIVRKLLDRATFTATDSALERRYLPLSRRAGLSEPERQKWVNGYRVDFFYPELGLVVETDGLRYHRTPAQQAVDRLRDQTHVAAGLTPVRFTRAQVFFAPEHVIATLRAVARGRSRG